MASVSGSKSSHNRQTSELRESRERYQKKIDELIKNQNLQIAKLTHHYDQELADMQKQNGDVQKSQRRENQDAITRRDMEYQQEVDNLRRMHAKQMEKLMGENQDTLQRSRYEANAQLHANQASHDERLHELEDDYADEQNTERNHFAQDIKDARASEQHDLNEVRHDFNERNREDLDAAAGGRDKRIDRLVRDNSELYRLLQERLQDQRNEFERDKNRLEAMDMSHLRSQEEIANANMQRTRDGFDHNLDTIRERDARARQDELAKAVGVDRQVRDNLEHRLDGQVRDLKFELARNHDAGIQSELNQKAKMKRQFEDMQDQYQARYDQLEQARRQSVNNSKDINAANIRKIHADDTKQMQDESRQLLGQMNLDNEENRNALANVKQQDGLRNEYETGRMRDRVKQVRVEAANNEKQLRNKFDTTVQTQQQSYQTKKSDAIYDITKRNNDEIRNLEAQAVKQQIEDQENLDDMQQRDRARIHKLNDEIVGLRQDNEVHERRLVTELQRQKAQELANQQIQFKERERQMELNNQRQQQEISRRDQAKLDQVVMTMKKQEPSGTA